MSFDIPSYLKDLIEQVLAACPFLIGLCTSSVRKQQIFVNFLRFAETIWVMINRRRERQQKGSTSNRSGQEETFYDEVYHKFMHVLYYFLVRGQPFCSWYAFFFWIPILVPNSVSDQFIDYVVDEVWPKIYSFVAT